MFVDKRGGLPVDHKAGIVTVADVVDCAQVRDTRNVAQVDNLGGSEWFVSFETQEKPY